MSDRIAPEWLQSAPHWYYTHIERGLPSVITVRRATRDQEVSDQAPGTLVLRVRPRRGLTLIFDIEGHDRGNIRREGARRYILRQNDTAIWKLTLWSIVRKRHQLQMIGGDVWTFDTPFFRYRGVRGTVSDHERLLGAVGPTMRHWGFLVDANQITIDLLAAVAYMHWKWWCW